MQRFTPRGVFVIFVLAAVLLVATTAAVLPNVRSRVREILRFGQREILAKTSGAISKEGPYVSVFKISEREGLALEIYTANDANGDPRLLQKIALDESHDGYLNFQGNATNLALSDTDGDGSLEIIAPTFDDQQNPRLNVFRYNRSLNTFERVTPPAAAGP